MFERFSPSARATVKRAHDVAAAEGSETVEAQHLLLALTQHADAPTQASPSRPPDQSPVKQPGQHTSNGVILKSFPEITSVPSLLRVSP